jgi:hypothetical protein
VATIEALAELPRHRTPQPRRRRCPS